MSLENIEDIYPLTATQAGMVYHAIAQPHAGVYTGQIFFKLEGAVDPAVMRETWNRVVARHAVLRTTILWDELEDPLQVVHREVTLPWQRLDWSDRSAARQAQDFEAWKTQDREAGFDLAEPPLIRITLIELGGDRSWLIWTSHHAIADGWSVSAVLNDMAAIYSSLDAGTDIELAPVFPYNRYVAWLQDIDLDKAKAYWRRRLAGFSEPTALLTARPSAYRADADTHDVVAVTLSRENTAAATAACKSAQISLFTLVQAAWGILLSRYSQRDDVVFGVTSAGRPAHLTGIESAVGLFLNTLPVRHQPDRSITVGGWLRQLQEESAEFLVHEGTPLPRVLEWSDLHDGSPLFDSILVMTNYPKRYAPDEAGLSWSVSQVDVVDHSNYSLALVITPGARLELKLVFDGNACEVHTARQILADLESLIDTLAREPRAPLHDVELPAGAARERLLAEFANGPELSTPAGTVLDAWHLQVEECPDRIALVFGEQRLTFAQLDQRAETLSSRLRRTGIGKGDLVAICLEPGIGVVESILAVFKSGAAYVPLDPSLPLRRIRHMVEDSGSRLIVTRCAQAGALSEPGVPLLCLDGEDPEAAGELRPRPTEDLAYVIFTSGSTGRPKGVAVSHANLAYSTWARQNYYPRQPGVFLLLSAYFFDSSVAGIFWTLASGGTLVLAENRLEQDMQRLATAIENEAVTHMLCLPRLYQAILEFAPVAKLHSLDTVILAGEVLPPEAVRQHRATLPHVRLYNEYGPTEGTVWCTVLDTANWGGDGAVSIGRPIPGARVYIMDANLRLAPVGVMGELCIGGPGVAVGYIGLPEDTAERFLPDPFHAGGPRIYRSGDAARYLPDGSVEFIGRQDEQVKIRGYRIELAEVEAALLEHPAIDEAVAMAVRAGRDNRQGQQLVVFILIGEEPPPAAHFKTFLRERLPEHMIPQRIAPLAEFPRLPNGKVDRDALRNTPAKGDAPDPAPGQPVDQEMLRALQEIWAAVLHIDSVQPTDNFFELGGDSLLSINVMSRARQQGIELKPSHLFDFPTPAELCTHLVEEDKYQYLAQDSIGGLRSRNVEGSRTPFFMVHGGRRILSELRHVLGEEQPLHVQPAHWDSGDIGSDVTLEQMADDAISNLLKLNDDGPYLIGGYSFGAVVAIEMARRLEKAGKYAAMLFMLDPPEIPDLYRSLPTLPENKLAAPRAHKPPLQKRLEYYRDRLPENASYWLAKACRALRLPEPERLKTARFRMHVAKTYIRASKGYDMPTLESPILVFRATGGYHKTDASIWHRVARGSLTIEEFDCDHEDLQWEPAMVSRWAQLFRSYLDEVAEIESAHSD